MPVPRERTGGRQPVLALAPGVGDIDMMVASELMEAGRAVAAGFVTPDRTLAIASTSRFYVMDEKIAMGDGRFDSDAPDEGDRGTIRAGAPAVRHGGDRASAPARMINAVMLGVDRRQRPAADPGRGVRSRDPRRRQGGRRQPARLPRRACDAARRRRTLVAASGTERREARASRRDGPRSPGLSGDCRRTMPPAARESSPKACAGSTRLSGRWPTRGSISTGSRRSARPTNAPARTAGCCARPRGIWRCACRTRT